jgi:mRNA-binding protein PUF3
MDYRSSSGSGLSSRVGMSQAALLDRKLSRLQQEQQGFMIAQQTPLQPRLPYGAHAYDFHAYSGVRMNPLNTYYGITAYPVVPGATVPPRGPSREQEQSQVIRSALLEEFRTSSKTTKRYELKVNLIHYDPLTLTDLE